MSALKRDDVKIESTDRITDLSGWKDGIKHDWNENNARRINWYAVSYSDLWVIRTVANWISP